MAILLDGRGRLPSFYVEGERITRKRDERIDVLADASVLDAGWDDEVEVGPGEVCAHTHLYSGLAPLGMPPPLARPENFVQILERVWWRLDRALDEASLRASARYYIAEALLAGTTTLVDHHESPAFIDGSLDVLADAAEALGVRLLVGYGATERNGGRDEAKRGLRECERFAKANGRKLVKPMVALHASFTVSDETIREAGALAKALGAPMHVHVAEDLADVEDAKKRGWEGPLERLLALDALPRGSIVAHGVHLSEEQVRKAEAAGAWIVQNPRSNRGNAVGWPFALAAARRVAIGTDGWNADMAEELRALVEIAEEVGDRRFTDDPEQFERRRQGGWRIAAETFGGAFLPPVGPGHAADLRIGSTAGTEDASVRRTGRSGDAVTYDVETRRLPPKPRHVVVAGRVVVKDGTLVTADLEEIRARAKEEAARLWKRMAGIV